MAEKSSQQLAVWVGSYHAVHEAPGLDCGVVGPLPLPRSLSRLGSGAVQLRSLRLPHRRAVLLQTPVTENPSGAACVPEDGLLHQKNGSLYY